MWVMSLADLNYNRKIHTSGCKTALVMRKAVGVSKSKMVNVASIQA